MSDRNEGNPNTRRTDREGARLGDARTPEEIPKQGSVPAGHTKVSTYKLVNPQRPPITHDNGFLALGRRAPTAGDYIKLAKWKAMLEGAEGLRPDLTDALGAYRHFLEGRGKTRNFSYERYVANDSSGQTTLKNAILDIQRGATELWQANPTLTSFKLTGSAISCGSGSQFPYPATENWQKAIGGHFIWLSGDVDVSKQAGKSAFRMTMTLHAEDRYNFNPGANDIATGIPDEDNGIFEMTGLGHQYDHFSVLIRNLQWTGLELGVSTSDPVNGGRHRQPQDNRRVRNRI
jgi:hypothetical protein